MSGRITVVGLGPANADLITSETSQIIAAHNRKFVRTLQHPSASAVVDAVNFDFVYDNSDSYEQVYEQICASLIQAAEHEDIVYAVPGSPLILERSVELLRHSYNNVKILPAVSFLDLAWARLGVDPVRSGVCLVDGLDFACNAAGCSGPLLVAHCHSQWVLSEMKLSVEKAPNSAILMQRLGLENELIQEVAWADIDRVSQADHLTSVFIPEMDEPVAASVTRFDELVRHLRERCPWDREQTHASLRRHLLEETYETLEVLDGYAEPSYTEPSYVESVEQTLPGEGEQLLGEQPPLAEQPLDQKSRAEQLQQHEQLALDEQLQEELGDLLYQIWFHARLAAERGAFTIVDVVNGVHQKLVARHPHVFGDSDSDTDASTVALKATVLSNWEIIKKREKGRESVMDGISETLPALLRAEKVLKRAETVGILPNKTYAKLVSELQEQLTSLAGWIENPVNPVDESVLVSSVGVPNPLGENVPTVDESTLGEAVLLLIEISHKVDVSLEDALRAATAKTEQAFRDIEKSRLI